MGSAPKVKKLILNFVNMYLQFLSFTFAMSLGIAQVFHVRRNVFYVVPKAVEQKLFVFKYIISFSSFAIDFIEILFMK